MPKFLLEDIIITIASFAGLLIIINTFDPYKAPIYIKFLFFSTALLAIIGTVIMPILIIKSSKSNSKKD